MGQKIGYTIRILIGIVILITIGLTIYVFVLEPDWGYTVVPGWHATIYPPRIILTGTLVISIVTFLTLVILKAVSRMKKEK